MAIGNAVQRGSVIYVYDEKGRIIFSRHGDELKGYTSNQVNIQLSSAIYSYNERGFIISTAAAPVPPPSRTPTSNPAPVPPPRSSGSANTAGNYYAPSSQANESDDNANTASGCIILLVLSLLAYGAYHYGMPVIQNLASVEDKAPAARNDGLPTDSTSAANDASLTSEATDRIKSFAGNEATEQDGTSSSDNLNGISQSRTAWAEETSDVNLGGIRIQKAVGKALDAGQPVRWKAEGRKGYAVPSTLQQGTLGRCRNLYLTIFADEKHIMGPLDLYCYDPSNESWAKK